MFIRSTLLFVSVLFLLLLVISAPGKKFCGVDHHGGAGSGAVSHAAEQHQDRILKTKKKNKVLPKASKAPKGAGASSGKRGLAAPSVKLTSQPSVLAPSEGKVTSQPPSVAPSVTPTSSQPSVAPSAAPSAVTPTCPSTIPAAGSDLCETAYETSPCIGVGKFTCDCLDSSPDFGACCDFYGSNSALCAAAISFFQCACE